MLTGEHAAVMFLASSSKGFDLFEYGDMFAIRFLDGKDITVLQRIFKRISPTKSFSQGYAVFCQLFLASKSRARGCNWPTTGSGCWWRKTRGAARACNCFGPSACASIPTSC